MGNKRRDDDKQQDKRIDVRHRFQIRIDSTVHNEAEAYAFKQNASLNLLYCEALKYALNSQGFKTKFEELHKRDERKGHFVFLVNENTKRQGKVL